MMRMIHFILLFFMFGFSIVGIGLRSAYTFINNEEEKNSIHEMALKWKATMEKNETPQND